MDHSQTESKTANVTLHHIVLRTFMTFVRHDVQITVK